MLLVIVSKIACQHIFVLSDPGVPRTFVGDGRLDILGGCLLGGSTVERFLWHVYSSLSPVKSLTMPRYCIRHEFGISLRPLDYSKLKQSFEFQTKINNGN